jgi:hypothetical protein
MFAQARAQARYLTAPELVHKSKEIGATPIFFVTWARRDGWPENGMNNFESMWAQTNWGTYLAGCVFYAVIFYESPNKLTYRAGLSPEAARVIQSIASSTVLNIP